MNPSPEYLAKLQTGLDVVFNAPDNCHVMGKVMTSPNAGIVPSRSASVTFSDDREVVL